MKEWDAITHPLLNYQQDLRLFECLLSKMEQFYSRSNEDEAHPKIPRSYYKSNTKYINRMY